MLWLMLPTRFEVGVFNPNGEHQIQFWTPTHKTQNSPGLKEIDAFGWAVADAQKKFDRFANDIQRNKKHIVGFRWHDVAGKGEGPYMDGAWWLVTLAKGYTCREFFKTYYEPTWKPGYSAVYYEINGVGDRWLAAEGKCHLEDRVVH